MEDVINTAVLNKLKLEVDILKLKVEKKDLETALRHHAAMKKAREEKAKENA